jgi:hypothetical protein
MKSKRRLAIIITVIIAALPLVACGKQDKEATPQVESSPVPSVSTESSSQEGQDDEEILVSPGTTTLDAFRISLLDALTQTPPDYATLQSYMSSEFWIFEPFVATNYSPADAVAQFEANSLPATTTITYDMAVDPHAKVTFPLPTDVDEYIYTTGWLEGSYLGVLLINSTPDGYEWVGVYLAPDKPQITEPIRIEFAPGATGATMLGGLAANGIDEYVLYAMEGQTMTVTITSPGDHVYLSIVGMSNGIPLVRAASDATSWTGVLPASQDYSIKAVSGVAVPSYQLEVFISPLDTSETTLDWVTLPDGICQDIEVMVAGELGVTDIGLDTNAPFEDYLGGTSGEGCLILVSGTGADFANHYDVFMQLKNMLVNIGWTPDLQYDGGGPTGTLGGFRRDAGLMLVTVGWEPSSNANCPQDQPISACSLTPEQQIYTITLSVAMQ